MALELTRFSSVDAFEGRALAWLLEREAEHNLIIGICGQVRDCGDPTHGTPPAGFDVELSLAGAPYSRGEPVQLALRVHNGSGETFTHEVGYPDAVFEIVTRGKLIWSSTWATAYPAIAFEETFAADETKTATVTWEQDLCRTAKDGIFGDPPFAPGPPRARTYTAYASWRGRWSAPPVTFTIGR